MTLKTDADLAQAMDALATLRLALAALKREVGERNARNFAIMAEGTVDEIARLESEVNEYVGLDDLRAQLWMRVEGDGMHGNDAPAAVLTSLLDAFRKGVQAATEHAHTGVLSARPTAEIQRAVDLRVTALAEGSLRIGLNVESPGQLAIEGTPSVADAAARSLKEYLAVAAWAAAEGHEDELAAVVPDPVRRRLLLTQVLQLAPRSRGRVESIELSGRLVRSERLTLTRRARERIAHAIDRVEAMVTEEHVGPLREIDLDHRTGVVRPEGAPDVSCEFAEELMNAAQEALGRNVRVVGNRTDAAGRRRATLFVTRLEIVGDPE